MYRLVALNG